MAAIELFEEAYEPSRPAGRGRSNGGEMMISLSKIIPWPSGTFDAGCSVIVVRWLDRVLVCGDESFVVNFRESSFDGGGC